jgi:hypothetical protein
LKINFDKKVSFGDQLAFGFQTAGGNNMFEAEMPPALEFKGGAKEVRQVKTGQSGKKKKLPNKKMGFFEGHIQALLDKKKVTGSGNKQPAVKKEPAVKQVPKGDFNLDTRP